MSKRNDRNDGSDNDNEDNDDDEQDNGPGRWQSTDWRKHEGIETKRPR